jgi:hypothetical protein
MESILNPQSIKLKFVFKFLIKQSAYEKNKI